MSIIRIGIGLRSDIHKRLVDVTTRSGIPQSTLLAAVVSVLSEKELNDIILRYRELLAMEEEIRSHADSNLLSYIRGRSLTELKIMAEAARNAGTLA